MKMIQMMTLLIISVATLASCSAKIDLGLDSECEYRGLEQDK